MARLGRCWYIVAFPWALLVGCSAVEEREVDAATWKAAREVNERVGSTFLEYYTEVVRLSRAHAAEPDSFRMALDALPGSHLSDEDWAAWSAPYAEDVRELVERLDEAVAGLPPGGN